MSKTTFDELVISECNQEGQSESSEFRFESLQKRGSQTTDAEAKRYHKIPLQTQIQLFQMVFQQGKRIKQVAKSLRMNYSSAKSLIHYYKKNKRPIPTAISSIISLNKTCIIKETIQGNDNFFVDIRINQKSIRKYNYYQQQSIDLNNVSK
ncbi:unnamed protein product (macronuclear) [Paramecium tetraurelia]|uniref:Paired domain-containing protein n=1 Tax=Paramecium tetraurelia TaxID=5888 RepID=A0E8B8_PARTE|nr:uncharacterized protein GSPATT00024263001 [Paramecium tetraurelia]CAK91535.1 unnamed protein product [Paramecium tetraurelia]|eukprot:XP_001458932.1 hypothetical protein (macronuclear) [Paramecium tetraurelia strain d4-2]